MIEVENLTKRYGNIAAVDHISFTVEQGEVLGFLGPNAAGKTTTLRMLTCFIPPSEGSAKVSGFDVFEDSLQVRRRLGYLPEHVPLYTEMRIGDYLDFVSKIKGINPLDRTKVIDSVLSRCGLYDVKSKIIGTLSKGYRQRVGLAQALLGDPEVLMLDEP
ncbi:MAG: ABC transporter ATP-binding protein, partial [bacterium]